MKFSIVIPARNGEKYLRSAIVSALDQTRPADEIIVVDDASADRTAVIARAPEYRGRVTYRFNETSTGFVDAWNRAIGLSHGDFIALLHQDDLLHRDYLLHVGQALSAAPQVRHIYAACDVIDENGCVTRTPAGPRSLEPVLYTGAEYAHRYLRGVATNKHIHRCPGVTTARALLLHECAYRSEAGLIADDDLFLRIGAFTAVIGIAAPLASYRQHPASTTSMLDDMTRALAEAYLFQTRCYLSSPGILSSDDVGTLRSLAVRFINLLLFQGLSARDAAALGRARSLRSEFESMCPSGFSPELPLWAKGMWECVRRTRRSSNWCHAYSDLLGILIRLRSGKLRRT